MFKIIKIIKWIFLLVSLVGAGAAGYLHVTQNESVSISPSTVVKSAHVTPIEQKTAGVISVLDPMQLTNNGAKKGNWTDKEVDFYLNTYFLFQVTDFKTRS